MATSQKIVCKFGGTSMATGKTFGMVKSIMESCPGRKGIVVSAPGKRFKEDIKTTDLLIQLHKANEANASTKEKDNLLEKISERFVGLLEVYGKGNEFKQQFPAVATKLADSKNYDYIVSRGEYLAGLATSEILVGTFLDPEEHVFLQEDGGIQYDLTVRTLARNIQAMKSSSDLFVLPGFFGLDEKTRQVRALPRGGSDISGALLSLGMEASCYENWTDVDGVFTADPNVIPTARKINSLTHLELRTLGKNGAQVLQPDTLKNMDAIPVHLRNTFNADIEGTHITGKSDNIPPRILGVVVGKEDNPKIVVVGPPNEGNDVKLQKARDYVTSELETLAKNEGWVSSAKIQKPATGGIMDPWFILETGSDSAKQRACAIHDHIDKKGLFDEL